LKVFSNLCKENWGGGRYRKGINFLAPPYPTYVPIQALAMPMGQGIG
jgi:hypothetical protein